MSLAQAIILGLVQGLAEFLPVSSSGHLVLFKDILGLSELPLLYDVILHLATLLAILLVFRRRVLGILSSLGRWAAKRNGREDAANLALVGPLLVATVVTAAIGFAIQKLLPAEGVRLVSIELLVSAAVLAASALLKPGSKGYADIGVGEGLFLGVAQGLGVFSGVSRSGMTITAGLAAGMRREEAGEFSFLLAIPAILGAFILELKDLGSLQASVEPLPLAVSALVAFLSGLLALSLLMRVVKRGKLAWFAAYLVPLGLAGLFLL